MQLLNNYIYEIPKINLIKFQNQNLNWIPTSQFLMKFFLIFFLMKFQFCKLQLKKKISNLLKCF